METIIKKIDQNTLEITTTSKVLVSKKKLETEKAICEETIARAQKEIDKINEKLARL